MYVLLYKCCVLITFVCVSVVVYFRVYEFVVVSGCRLDLYGCVFVFLCVCECVCVCVCGLCACVCVPSSGDCVCACVCAGACMCVSLTVCRCVLFSLFAVLSIVKSAWYRI